VARSAEVVAAVGQARLGAAPQTLVVDGCTHLLWRFGHGQRRVLLLGHHDTVWPLGSLRAHPAQLRDGLLRGPGCLDMKAGLVIAMHALAAHRVAGGSLDGVSLLITGDEELGAPSSRALIEREARDCSAVLVLESASPAGALKLARKGRARYDVAIAGRATHAGLEPQAGINAALALAQHLLAVVALADAAAGTTVTPTLLSGGTAANTVPERAQFTIDVRAATLAELERVDAGVRSLDPVLPGARVTVSGGIEAPPLEPAASAALFPIARELAPGCGLDELGGVAVGGGSDGNFTASLGIPTLDGLGATGDGIHAAHEHVIVDDLPGRAALVAALVGRLLTGAPAR
jgi:glutamate carboxypeptidase